MEDNRLNLSQQALAFDVNADVEPIPQDEEHNDLFGEGSCFRIYNYTVKIIINSYYLILFEAVNCL